MTDHATHPRSLAPEVLRRWIRNAAVVGFAAGVVAALAALLTG